MPLSAVLPPFSLPVDPDGHFDVNKMVNVFSALVDYFAPLFLVASPITSYADQIFSIHRSKSSQGFSLDIPLIMLMASILKVFYYFGERYDTALLIQAILMIAVQLILLKVALDNRGSGTPDDSSTLPVSEKQKHNLAHQHFPGYQPSSSMLSQLLRGQRPSSFWRWPTSRPYFMFLLYLTLSLTFIQLFLPFIAQSPLYISLLGYVGLAIEATLPLPQVYKNWNQKSCRGFRLSVIANWLLGDAMKMGYFFGSSEPVPWPFKACGLFQAGCDTVLGLQFWIYGSGVGTGLRVGEKGILG